MPKFLVDLVDLVDIGDNGGGGGRIVGKFGEYGNTVYLTGRFFIGNEDHMDCCKKNSK